MLWGWGLRLMLIWRCGALMGDIAIWSLIQAPALETGNLCR